MTRPTINDVQAVDPVLTNMLVAYMQADIRFVADRVFPGVPVDKDSGTYYIFSKKYFMSDTMLPRAPGGPFPMSGFGVTTGTYTTIQYALAHAIADEERANSQLPMDLETATVQWLAQKNLIKKERAFAADFMVNNVWDNNDNNSTDDWDDFALGDPVADIKTGIRTISNATGQMANTLVCGHIVHEALTNHPDILDRIKYVQVASAGNVAGAMADVFGISNYWPALGAYNSADEGQTVTAAAIIDDDALLTVVNPGAGVFGVTGGKTFTWQAGGGTGTVSMERDALKKADVVMEQAQWDQVIVATDLGYLWLDVV